MTTYATNITPFAAPARNRTGPLAATVTGAIAAFFAVVLIAGGAALLWVSYHKTDAAGYYTTATHHYSTPTRALTTQSLDVDVDDDAPDWLFSSGTFGHLRIDPRATDSSKPVFVGVARTNDVDAYLEEVQRDEITDLDFDPFSVATSRVPGEGRPAMPAAQGFWAASSTDGRPLDWKVRSGEWSVVMMNADGSPGVNVDATVGTKTPLIRNLAWILTLPGLGLGLIALVLLAFGVRGITRTDRPAAAPAPAPAG